MGPPRKNAYTLNMKTNPKTLTLTPPSTFHFRLSLCQLRALAHNPRIQCILTSTRHTFSTNYMSYTFFEQHIQNLHNASGENGYNCAKHEHRLAAQKSEQTMSTNIVQTCTAGLSFFNSSYITTANQIIYSA